MKAIFRLKNTNRLQKQPPEVFCKKGVLKKFTKFTGKHLSHKNYHIKTSENLKFQIHYQMLEWKTLYLQSLQTYDFKTIDFHKT